MKIRIGWNIFESTDTHEEWQLIEIAEELIDNFEPCSIEAGNTKTIEIELDYKLELTIVHVTPINTKATTTYHLNDAYEQVTPNN